MGNRTPEAAELVAIRESLRFTQEQFAAKLGMEFSQYRNNEYRKPSADILRKARALKNEGYEPLVGAMGSIKRLGAIGANHHGPGYEGDENEMIVPIAFAKEDYRGVPVPSGELSMIPFIQPGDTLIFKPGSKLHMFVAARLRGETLPVCKKLTTDVEGRAVLRSMNPGFEDMPGRRRGDFRVSHRHHSGRYGSHHRPRRERIE